MVVLGRVPEVDIEDDRAMRIFEANCSVGAAGLGVEQMFSYAPLDFRRRSAWDKLAPHKSVLFDLFQASHGFLIHQKSLEAQMMKFMLKHSISDSQVDADRAVYKLRVMMSHLRDSKVNGRAPPIRFDNLQYILDAIDVGRPPKAQAAEPDQDAVGIFASPGPSRFGWNDPHAGVILDKFLPPAAVGALDPTETEEYPDKCFFEKYVCRFGCREVDRAAERPVASH